MGPISSVGLRVQEPRRATSRRAAVLDVAFGDDDQGIGGESLASFFVQVAGHVDPSSSKLLCLIDVGGDRGDVYVWQELTNPPHALDVGAMVAHGRKHHLDVGV